MDYRSLGNAALLDTKTCYDRFWEKVDVRSSDECWNWLASRNTSGYGKMQVDGRLEYAHR